MNNEQRAQFARQCKSATHTFNGEPNDYTRWTSAERLAYLDGWSKEMLGTNPPERTPAPAGPVFFNFGQLEARAYKLLDSVSP